METTMIKSIAWTAALLFAVFLMSSAFASAGAGGTFVLDSAGPAARMNAINPAVHPAQIPVIWANPLYTGGDGYPDYDKYKHKDHRHDHDPAPEPSTLLSFGAALLIGGAVLYSRRLRRKKH